LLVQEWDETTQQHTYNCACRVWRQQGDKATMGGGGQKDAAPYEPLLVGWFVCVVSARRREMTPPAPAPHYCEHLLAAWNRC
jgi:hypothetical protein